MELDRKILAELIRENRLFATTGLLVEAALHSETDGLSWLDWDPITVQMELEQACGVGLSQSVLDRIMIGHRLRTSDAFYKQVSEFVETCNVLSGSAFDPRVFDFADAAEMSWGVLEAALISPPEEDPPFSEDILRYIGAALSEEGLVHPPKALAMAIRDTDVPTAVTETFADDPELQSAVMQNADTQTSEIDGLVLGRLQELLRQVDLIGLKTADGRPMSEGLLAAMKDLNE